ncbi:MAG TPA: hypothetical protein VMB79_11115 [Jatrophihabitans sp.]|nr:hypothetical protein [Jatrophihabitans sp.]
MSDFSFDALESRVGDEFVLRLPDGGQVPMRLLECSATGPDGARNSFVLTFKAGRGAPIEQAIYLVEATGIEPEPIFLVPARDRPDDPDYPLEYHAVFNRMPG